MLSCKEVSQLVSESLDRDLPFWQRLQVRMHLLMCRFCSRFRKQILFLRDAARHFVMASEDTGTAVSPGLSAEACDRIKRSLKANMS